MKDRERADRQVPGGEARSRSPAEGDRAREELCSWLKSLFFALVLVLVFRTHVAEGYQIRGASMEPTLANDDRLFVEKITPRFQPYEPGDIIVFPHPREGRRGKKLIKRVLAVGGQHVEIREGRLWVDGEEQVEEYILEQDWVRGDREIGVIPEGMLFLLGDNRNSSNDSRGANVGLVAEESVVGRAFVRFWPLERLEVFQ